MDPYESFYSDLFGVRKSVRYHQRRRAFFELWHAIAVAVQVIAGSSAVTATMGNYPLLGSGLAAPAALLAAPDLTIGLSRRATAHVSLGQQFAQLERDMVPFEQDRNIQADKAAGFQPRRLAIEESEPPKLRAVDILCHNELVVSRYRHAEIYPVSRVRNWVGHVFDVEVNEVLANPQRVRALGEAVPPAGAAAAS